MSYTITIGVLGPVSSSTCCPPLVGQTCQRKARYSIKAVQQPRGDSTSSSTCQEHLLQAISYLRALPEAALDPG